MLLKSLNLERIMEVIKKFLLMIKQIPWIPSSKKRKMTTTMMMMMTTSRRNHLKNGFTIINLNVDLVHANRL